MGGVMRHALRSLSFSFLFSTIALFITACGNNSGNSSANPGAAPESRAWLSNVSLENSSLSSDKTCAQLTQGNSTKYLELGEGQCPSQGLAPRFQKRLTAYEPSQDVSTSNTTLYLFEQSLLVGELEKTKDGWELRDLCSGDFYAANCELQATNGSFSALKVTPEKEVTNKQLSSQNRVLKKLITLLEQGLNDRVGDLLETSNLVKKQKGALTDVLSKSKGNVAKLRATLAVELNGSKDNGLLHSLSDQRAAVLNLQKALESRKDGLEALNAPVRNAQEKLEAATQALNAKASERTKLQAQLKLAAEPDKKGLEEQLATVNTELGSLYADTVDKSAAVDAALTVKNSSALSQSDEKDRQALASLQGDFTKLLKKVNNFEAASLELDGMVPQIDAALKYASGNDYAAAIQLFSTITLRWETVKRLVTEVN